ncbi:toxic anion resistance protein [Kallipyga massiliensis]|uniref:toxic anion resistance protein n=1 Tax=Kallipyga massiliensis TaxID=1472764 RepID=UPI0026EF93F3|nr:toxic anion resistance protein [Kallipyga massiliensis]
MEEKTNYKLDDLLAAPAQKAAGIMDPEEAEKVTHEDLPMLSEEDQAKVQALKEELDLRNSSLSTFYGSVAQENMAEFSNTILSEVQAKDSGEVGALLTDLLVKVDSSNGEDKGSFLDRLFSSGKNRLERYLASYRSLSQNIDAISAKLQDEQKALMKQVTLFDQLYAKNLQEYRDLEIYIQAGQAKLQEMRQEALPSLYDQAKASDNPMALQVVKDLEANVDRFDRKIHELKVSQTLALQTAPQIKLIQNNNQLLVDKINDVVVNTIPLWRSQTVIALGLAKQEEALDMQRNISEATNRLIQGNAQKLKQVSLGVREEAERSTVDIESLEAANQDLIDTIKGSLEISKEARAKRADAEKRMVKIKDDLQQALRESLEEK